MPYSRDYQLLARVGRGARDSFNELYRRHHGWTAAICRSFARNREHAEDLNQQVWLRIFEKARPVEEHALRSWIGRIAFRVCMDDQRRVDKSVPAVTVEDWELVQPVTTETPDSALEKKEAAHHLWSTVAQIPHGGIMQMHFLEGMTYAEIGGRLGVHEEAVRDRMRKAKNPMNLGDINLHRQFGAGAICTGLVPIRYEGPKNAVELYEANYWSRLGSRAIPTFHAWDLEFNVHNRRSARDP